MAEQAFNLFATDESMPRFAFLRALAASRRSQRIDTLRLEMQQVIDEYPGTEVAEAATDILKTFGKYTSSGEMTESLAAATADTTGYTCDRTETQAFCWYLSGEENLNQIVFDLENHHADFYPDAGLELEQAELPQEATLLVVTPCMTPANAEAYYRQFMAEQPTGHLRGQPVCFLITESDLALLREAGTIRAYLHCFETRFDDLFHPAP